MPAFAHTLRALRSDGYRATALALGLAVLLLAGWLAWLVLGRVAVYAVSQTARLEVNRAAHPVVAEVEGRIVAVRVALGQKVAAGDVLVELDAATEQLALKEEEARLTGLQKRLAAKRVELAAESRVLDETRRTSDVVRGEARARHREAELAAQYAAAEARRQAALFARGGVSPAELQRVQADAEQRREAARALGLASSRQGDDQRIRERREQAAVAHLGSEIAELEADCATLGASIRRRAHEIALRKVRASVGGTIGDVGSELRVGAVVRAGQALAAIVPAGGLKVVAEFAPAAVLGRVRPGQRATVRLAGFPWAQYGTIAARVARVASEVQNDDIRVELELVAGGSTIPLQHGLPGVVEVELERVSPAMLLLRALGQELRAPAADG